MFERSKNMNYGLLPEHMRDSMKAYIEGRVPPGGFLTAVLSNNLMDACARADHINIKRLPDYCLFLYNEAPRGCHGSPEKVKAWLKKGESR
jgi:hypothetical protein